MLQNREIQLSNDSDAM